MVAFEDPALYPPKKISKKTRLIKFLRRIFGSCVGESKRNQTPAQIHVLLSQRFTINNYNYITCVCQFSLVYYSVTQLPKKYNEVIKVFIFVTITDVELYTITKWFKLQGCDDGGGRKW